MIKTSNLFNFVFLQKNSTAKNSESDNKKQSSFSVCTSHERSSTGLFMTRVSFHVAQIVCTSTTALKSLLHFPVCTGPKAKVTCSFPLVQLAVQLLSLKAIAFCIRSCWSRCLFLLPSLFSYQQQVIHCPVQQVGVYMGVCPVFSNLSCDSLELRFVLSVDLFPFKLIRYFWYVGFIH